jgi:hypothetical protein
MIVRVKWIINKINSGSYSVYPKTFLKNLIKLCGRERIKALRTIVNWFGHGHKTIVNVTFFFWAGGDSKKNENSATDVRVSFETFHTTMLAPLRETPEPLRGIE